MLEEEEIVGIVVVVVVVVAPFTTKDPPARRPIVEVGPSSFFFPSFSHATIHFGHIFICFTRKCDTYCIENSSGIPESSPPPPPSLRTILGYTNHSTKNVLF